MRPGHNPNHMVHYYGEGSAQAVMQRMAFVGVMERFDESMK